MRKHIVTKIGLATVAAAFAIGGTALWAKKVHASDHDESPLVKKDASVDLTDLYVFSPSAGKTTIIVDWGGFNDSRAQPDKAGLYNESNLYTVNIDNNGDNVADIKIYWRFGHNSSGAMGVSFEGIPGESGNVVSPVETVTTGSSGVKVWSGHADDPFFFDVQGYLDTLDTGKLSITSKRDTLAGLKVTAAAIEIDTAKLQNGSAPIQVWVTSAQK